MTEFFIEKRGLFIEKNDLFIEKNGLFTEKNGLFIEKNDLFIEKNGLFIEKNDLFIEKKDLFIERSSGSDVLSQLHQNCRFRLGVTFPRAFPGSVGTLDQGGAAGGVGQAREVDADVLIGAGRRRPSHLRADAGVG